MSSIPNTTPTPNIIYDYYLHELSDTALRIVLIIIRKTYGWVQDPDTGMRKREDWISYSQMAQFTGKSRPAIAKALRELENHRLIDIRSEKGTRLTTVEDRRGKKLMYRFVTSKESLLVRTTSKESEVKKVNSQKKLITKTLLRNGSDGVKTPHCPLVNGSALREKYPKGHEECVEYLLSTEEARGTKFANRPKQFLFLHKLLQAGYDFDRINRTVRIIEKKYGANQYDFATIASWADKGA